jgi:FkbM family methyltransferase
LHVGAHEAEELNDYQKQGWNKCQIIWIDAQPNLVEKLKDRLDPRTNTVIQAAVWNVDGEDLILNVASNSQSTSLLDLGTHSTSYPDIQYVSKLKVKTATLSSILEGKPAFDFINLDIQGVELQALEGLGDRLSNVKWIYTEVNSREVYKGCTLVTELDCYLSRYNFQRVATKWAGDAGWGDALYLHENLISKNGLRGKIILSKILSALFLLPRMRARLLRISLRNKNV